MYPALSLIRFLICGGFSIAENLGRYLGAHIFYGRTSPNRYRFLTDKINSKLGGWKKRLSLVGRITLANSVLGSMASYHMQHEKIPKSILLNIERSQRDFIWGSNPNGRKPHLVSWEVLCKPKHSGGMDFKNLSNMNDAFLLKIGWEALTNKDALWVKVIRGKYDRAGIDNLQVKASPTDSRIWKAIVRLWPHVTENTLHILGNGNSTEFWNHAWIDGNMVLSTSAINPIEAFNNHSKVIEFVKEDGYWDTDKISNLLSEEKDNRIRAVVPPAPLDGPDRFAWGLALDGMFSAKSAYQIISNQLLSQVNPQTPWKHIWCWKGPYRITVFMWISTHNKLMTTLKRSRWTGSCADCSRCSGIPETVTHILRIFQLRVPFGSS